jgi:hypothetical protein
VRVWVGRVLSGLVVLTLLVDAAIEFFAPEMMRAAMDATGFPTHLAPALGAIMLVCAVLYAIPKTASLGAILVTGFLGGAICTHLRLGEIASPPQLVSLMLGAMTWGGLYLRDARIRALLPLRVSGNAATVARGA